MGADWWKGEKILRNCVETLALRVRVPTLIIVSRKLSLVFLNSIQRRKIFSISYIYLI